MADQMTDQQRIAALAAGMAAANPDAAEILAEQLGRAARREKVGGGGLGIAIRFNALTGQIEMRGGLLGDYVVGKAPGDGYVESKWDLEEETTPQHSGE